MKLSGKILLIALFVLVGLIIALTASARVMIGRIDGINTSVVDGDYERSRELYLKHAFEGLPLDEEYCRQTLGHIYELWQRPVILETADLSNGKPRSIYYRIENAEQGVEIRHD